MMDTAMTEQLSSSLHSSGRSSSRGGVKRSLLAVTMVPLDTLRADKKEREGELLQLKELLERELRNVLKEEGVSPFDDAFPEEFSRLEKNQHVGKVIREAISKKKEELEKATATLAKAEDEHVNAQKKPRMSLSPSSLNASNIQHARGSVGIHDRDSGVARHEAFLSVLKSLEKSTWQEKKDFLIKDCPNFFKKPPDSNIAESDIDGHIRNLFQRISSAQRKNQGSGSLEKRESVFSEELSFYLTEFCVESGLPIRFTHQYPTAIVGSSEDKADISCFSLDNDKNRRLRGHIVVKRADSCEARWQLCGYASETYHEKIYLSFCLSIDHYVIALYGFMQSSNPGNQDGRLLVEHSLLQKGKEQPTIESILASYFLALLLSTSTFDVWTSGYSFCPGHADATYLRPKVYRFGDNSVGKVFDCGPVGTSERKPNESFWKTALPGTTIELEHVKGCLNVSVLVTPFFDGQHKPSHPIHIALLCDQLQLLHKKGQCHGDVLCQNILFEKSETTKSEDVPFKTALIDYDYSHLQEYPRFWNTSFAERHPHAKAGLRVRTEHDVYAAIAILCIHFKFQKDNQESKPLWSEFADGEFSSDDHPELLREWYEKSAQDVADWIRKNSNRIAMNAKDNGISPVQFGSPPAKKRNDTK